MMRPYPLDPMAAQLETWVRPRLIKARRAALLARLETQNQWMLAERGLDTPYDTVRIERLIDCAWNACCDALKVWDARVALQAVRTLPPDLVVLMVQGTIQPDAVFELLKVLTAAALRGKETRWGRVQEDHRDDMVLTEEQWRVVAEHAPRVLGAAIGAA